MYQNFARFFDRKLARQARPHRAQKRTAAGAVCRLRPRSFFISAFFFLLCLGQLLGCGNGCGGHLNGTGLQQRRRTGGRCGPCRDNVIDQQHPLAGQVGAGAAGKGCFRAAQPFLAGQLLLRAARILYVERRRHGDSQHCAQPARQQKRQPRAAACWAAPAQCSCTAAAYAARGTAAAPPPCGRAARRRSAPPSGRPAPAHTMGGRRACIAKSRRALHRRSSRRPPPPPARKKHALLPAGAAADAAAASPPAGRPGRLSPARHPPRAAPRKKGTGAETAAPAAVRASPPCAAQ